MQARRGSSSILSTGHRGTGAKQMARTAAETHGAADNGRIRQVPVTSLELAPAQSEAPLPRLERNDGSWMRQSRKLLNDNGASVMALPNMVMAACRSSRLPPEMRTTSP